MFRRGPSPSHRQHILKKRLGAVLLRYRWTLLCVFILVLLYIYKASASHSLNPKLCLFLTSGASPWWPYILGYDVIKYQSPEVAYPPVHYGSREIEDFLSDLGDIERHLAPAHRNMDLRKLQAFLDDFPENIQGKIERWYEVNVNSSYLVNRTITDYLTTLKYTRTRIFPTRQREVDCDGCFKYNYRRLISPRMVCNHGDEVDLVALVTTSPVAIKARQAIRQTWGSFTRNNTSNFRLVFLFGDWSDTVNRDLQKENDLYGDILQDDFIDHYYNLSYKVIMGYKYGLEVCPHAKFFMRGAEDTFVNIPLLLSLLEVHGSDRVYQDFQVGYCLANLTVPREPESRTYTSSLEYKLNIFPPYALGTTTLTSNSLTRRVYQRSADIAFLAIEDAYFGLVLWRLHSGCLGVQGFYPDPGPYKQPFFASHKETPQSIYKLFNHYHRLS